MFIEDLENELIINQEYIYNLTNQLIFMFDAIDFDKEVTPNGISFQKTLNEIHANFYIDEELNYKSYITNNKSNYSSKGKSDNVIEGAKNFIDIYSQFLYG